MNVVDKNINPTLIVKISRSDVEFLMEFGIFNPFSRVAFDNTLRDKFTFELDKEELEQINSNIAEDLRRHDKAPAWELDEEDHERLKEMFDTTETMIANLTAYKVEAEEHIYDDGMEL